MAWETRTEAQIAWDEAHSSEMGRLLYHLDTQEGALQQVVLEFNQGEPKHSDKLYRLKVNQSWLQRVDGFLHKRLW